MKKLKITQGDQITVKLGSGIQKGSMEGPYVPPSDKLRSLERRKMKGDNSCLFHSVAYS
jgi:hypothetical protein